ncbi:hypothetical protein AAMO2058_000334600 [Amorphochlora amoebiformis]
MGNKCSSVRCSQRCGNRRFHPKFGFDEDEEHTTFLEVYDDHDQTSTSPYMASPLYDSANHGLGEEREKEDIKAETKSKSKTEEEQSKCEEAEKRTMRIFEKEFNRACEESGITPDWLIDRIIPENFGSRNYLSTFPELRDVFMKLVKDPSSKALVREWASDHARASAFASFQRHARTLTDLISDVKSGIPRKLQTWIQHGVDVREYKGKNVVMMHKNTPVLELMIQANSRRIPPFQVDGFRKELPHELSLIDGWGKGKGADRAQVLEACDIVFDVLQDDEIEVIEMELSRHSTSWGAPNRLAGHVLNLTGAGMKGLYEMWESVCRSHQIVEADIKSSQNLEQILFYDELLGSEDGKPVYNIMMLPTVGCPFKLWRHLLLKLAKIRGYNVQQEKLDNKALEYDYKLRKEANEEALSIIGECTNVTQIQNNVRRALKKIPSYKKGFTMESIQVKRLILTDRGLTPQFIMNSFQDMLEYIILTIKGTDIQSYDHLRDAIEEVLLGLPSLMNF